MCIRDRYSTFGRDPALLHTVSMLYFAAATTWERRRVDESAHRPQAYLLADDSDWLDCVDQCLLQLRDLQTGDADAIAEFAGTAAVAIASYNTVGSVIRPRIICIATRQHRRSTRGNT